jgi:poly-gamma-glutamate capsule biosynthesis protein CapA/YwtB (metallophosphatase superfamily)
MSTTAQRNGVVTLCAVGDVSPRRRDPDYPYKEPALALSGSIMREADIAFGQLEKIMSDRVTRSYYNTVVHPDNVQTLVEGGFDVMSFAGNHHMDAGVDPFVETLDLMKANKILVCGAGMNITEARSPAIVERAGIRVAFLGYSSILRRSDVPYEAEANRPGCAPMFVSTFYDQTDFQPATPNPRIVSLADKRDLEAMQEDIQKARTQADVVVMSIHWGVHHVPGLIAMYQYEVGHAAVDAGVDLILGHHAHILKGIEVYKGKVIFYSLGNFIVDSPIKRGIVGRWEGASEDHTQKDLRPFDPEYPTYRARPDERQTMIAKVLLSDGKIDRVSFLPCLINKSGQAEPLGCEDPRSDEVYTYMNWCCTSQGLATRLSRDGDEVVVLT